MVSQDIPAYCLASGDRAQLRGLNQVGLSRYGLSNDQKTQLRSLYRSIFRDPSSPLYRSRLKEANMEEVQALLIKHKTLQSELQNWIEFLRTTKRGICRSYRSTSTSNEPL